MASVLGSIVGMILAGLLLLFLSYGCEESSCSAKARKMGFHFDYGLMQGCMIRVESQWVPIESYRTVEGGL